MGSDWFPRVKMGRFVYGTRPQGKYFRSYLATRVLYGRVDFPSTVSVWFPRVTTG